MEFVGEEPIYGLVSFLESYGYNSIKSSSGSLEEDEMPYPWVSISPESIRECPEHFLILLSQFGVWNMKHPTAQWIYRPVMDNGQQSHCLLEPLERNKERNGEVLKKLQRDCVMLPGGLHSEKLTTSRAFRLRYSLRKSENSLPSPL